MPFSSDMQEDRLPDVGLSILTWKSPKTLERTLRSLAPVSDLFAERKVVCQEGDPEEMDIARKFGFDPVPTKTNLGIQEGLAHCAECLESERILIVESDNMFVEQDNARDLLKRALILFDQHEMTAFQLSMRPTHLSDRFLRYWRSDDPLRKNLRGHVWPRAARMRVHGSLALPDTTANGNRFIRKLEDELYLTRSDCISWSNRPFLTRRSFFLGPLMTFARQNPGKKRVNGMPDLEHPINCPANRYWWCGLKAKVGVTYPGLFEHDRLERPEDDEKTAL
ncbi:hypothetical protein [uncultured Martelella sp.]|uniref:hypothetical protein n=1 Tax=uncultured Martelella sp. TaxID=392331 RepID=UPI0029C7BE2C|nr:hypothetical protein [uncultured Martelella sp.]